MSLFFGDIRLFLLITITCFILLVDVLAAKPLAVPFFALRRHQTSMRHSFGGHVPQTGTDVFGSQFMTSGMRAGRGKSKVPNYGGGLMDDEGDDEARRDNDYESNVAVTLPPQPALMAVGQQFPASNKNSKDSSDVYLSNLPSRSMIDRIEHPIAAHRFKMNPGCLMDPPIKARYARSLITTRQIAFYSFNPAGQSCDKLIIDEKSLTAGPNMYSSLRECQLDCCPTALCLRM